MKLLCAGDLHIGRRSSRLPPDAEPHAFSAASAWQALVSVAVDVGVDAVLLSGDVVDRDNRYFEAFGALEGGVRRLAAAGIPVVAVAGNHDHAVLPALARSLGPDFTLLGRGGQWEEHHLGRDGGGGVRVLGWSFPSDRVPGVDFEGFPAADGRFTVGLLHGDLDAPSSPYAPVARAQLRARDAHLWVMGHVHAPAHHRELQPSILYTGSTQALDPGEPGQHGAHLVEIAADGSVRIEHLPLSTVRYDTVTVDADVPDSAALQQKVAEAVRDAAGALAGTPRLRELVLRIDLVGVCGIPSAEVVRVMGEARDIEVTAEELRATVERTRIRTEPKADLRGLATVRDPPGVLANFILQLDDGSLDAQGERLLGEMATRVAALRSAPSYQSLPHEELDPAALRRTAREQAMRLLTALLTQKEVA
jgi:DNA repair protein SbcD/Mre11